MTDPIADLLTRIRNAYLVGKKTVTMPHSKMKEAVARVLTEEKYLDGFVVEPAKPQSTLQVTLKYIDNKPAVSKIDRISSPGRRTYSQAKRLRPVLSGHGIAIISTSQGLMTDKQARAQHLGGEVICRVW